MLTIFYLIAFYVLLKISPKYKIHFSGVSHLCYSIKQNEENTVTVTFCQDGSGSGKTIFLVSGAQKYETVHSCICTFGISDAVRNISLSYNAGNAIGNCGVKITIVDESNELTCTSTDLAVQTLKTVEFSRSSIKETHFCLEISLGRYRDTARRNIKLKDIQ